MGSPSSKDSQPELRALAAFMRHNVLARASKRNICRPRLWRQISRTQSSVQPRQRRDDIWIPSVNINKQDGPVDATQSLVKAGYLRQAYAGIYHMLPLGLRVQEKLERLIDKHMKSLKASKVSLSSISSQALWRRSGRLKAEAEFFTFQDRKDAHWLLAPTHEEEITNLLIGIVHTRQQLPVRLYQISRKYRDEKRPRGGLLRGKEFIMKDLYTFDNTPAEAHATYDEIRQAYRNFLDELKIKYVEARAESGDMGGNLSHEYHFPNAAGEDVVITCSKCDYARNEEFVSQGTFEPQILPPWSETESNLTTSSSRPLLEHDVISTDGHSLVRALARRPPNFPADQELGLRPLNGYAIKAALDGFLDLNTGVENPRQVFEQSVAEQSEKESPERREIYYVLDQDLDLDAARTVLAKDREWLAGQAIDAYIVSSPPDASNGIHLLKHQPDDPCPECKEGKLQLQKAIEIGHTFHLGTRYSSKLGLAVRSSGSRPQKGEEPTAVEMGCHGIGVSRLIAATTACLSDDSGLNWPRVIAPFEVAILVKQTDSERLSAAHKLYDDITLSDAGTSDVLLDDRADLSLGWKMNDADMIGYPVIVVVGKTFDQGEVEVQCRRLKVKQHVPIDHVVEFVHQLLRQL